MEKLVSLLFSPAGRLNRMEYFLYSVAVSVALLVMGAVIVAIVNGSYVPVLLVFLLFAYFYIMITFDIKRLHDIGYPGWHMAWIVGLGIFSLIIDDSHDLMLSFLAVVQLVINLILLFAPGTKETNDFGPQK